MQIQLDIFIIEIQSLAIKIKICKFEVIKFHNQNNIVMLDELLEFLDSQI